MSSDDLEDYEHGLRVNTARNNLIRVALALVVLVPLIGFRLFALIHNAERLSRPARTPATTQPGVELRWLAPDDSQQLDVQLTSSVDIAEFSFKVYGAIPPEVCLKFRTALAAANPKKQQILQRLDTVMAKHGCR